MDSAAALATLAEAARAVRDVLNGLDDWGPAGTRPGQYRSDLAADEAALAVLTGAGMSVLSEESGMTVVEGSDLLAVLDPVDGSTNASRGIPWYATSICALDDGGPLAAVVVNQATGVLHEAERGRGARRNGAAIHPSGATQARRSVVGLSGYPLRYLGWKQFRALGAVALDLCAVADGTLDAYVDCGRDAHGPWDYLGGLLVCSEAGATVLDAFGRNLVVREHSERRTPVAGATAALAAELLAARNAPVQGSA